MSLTNRIASFWLRPPSARNLALFAGLLAVFFVFENVGAIVIASAVGYRGSIGAMFSLSMTFAYSPTQAAAALTGLGANGRTADALTLIGFDVLFPLVYASCLSFGLRFLALRLGLPKRVVGLLGWFPFVAGIANWLADGAIIGLIHVYPSTPVALAGAASALTTLKLSVIALSAVAMLFGFAAFGVGRMITRPNAE